jgi:serine/threonine protein kinase/formylglycine-generating enzyme required for sulfatase activity
MSTPSLLESLSAADLLTAEQLSELARLPEAQDSDSRALARALVRRGRLTRYQINEVAAGRGKSLRIGSYVVLERLGEGGMGQVFKARHQHMDRVVAIKVMRKESLQSADSVRRFYQEIKAAAALMHPNIVMAFDAGQVGTTHYYSMEYVDGPDLDRLVSQSGPLPVAQACDFIRQAALGLQHAHERGLVHRDVKPSNLLVSSPPGGPPVVKVLDLGLARLTTSFPQQRKLTRKDQMLGTPDYLAPEQALDARKADIRADVYSLGCSLFFLLTGRAPFQAEALAELLLKHQSEPPPSVRSSRPDAPLALDALLKRMLAKKPEQRPSTPAEVAAALEPLARGSEVGPVLHALLPASEPGDGARTEFLDGHHSSHNGISPPPASDTQARDRERQYIAVKPGLLVGAAIGFGAVFFAGLVLAVLLVTARPDKGRPAAPGSLGTQAPAPKPAAVAGGEIKDGIKRQPEKPPGEPIKPPLPPKPPPAFAKVVTNSIGMKLVLIPAGTFLMGSPATERERRPDEAQHEVALTRDYWLGAAEVTQRQFRVVMGYNPSFFSTDGPGRPGLAYPVVGPPAGGRNSVKGMSTDDFPVENVSYEEAVELCQKLSELLAERRAGRAYRLPTEAEWECACRGGDPRIPFYFGHSFSSTQANFNGNFPYGGAARGAYLVRPCEVGSYKANTFGLFDMHGNVWEWCSDWYEADYYGKSPRRDPPGPAAGVSRVIRGGSWLFDGAHCRSACRDSKSPADRNAGVGFRVALMPARR